MFSNTDIVAPAGTGRKRMGNRQLVKRASLAPIFIQLLSAIKLLRFCRHGLGWGPQEKITEMMQLAIATGRDENLVKYSRHR
mmetsp:Transcript_29322/g.46072  ORF Transcript_29322/g.46072 Transcript_29322/m.46072 type:complete len:82 (+) Transcript_29322:513-758(+)